MEKVARMNGLNVDADRELRPSIRKLRADLELVLGRENAASPLDRLPPQKRSMYEHLFGLIYECSTNRVAAKALVDRNLIQDPLTARRCWEHP